MPASSPNPSSAAAAADPGTTVRLAVIGAGPVGLALAVLAARRWPAARVTVFDARPADKNIAADPRTLALSLGSVELLRELGAWPEAQAQAIMQVHVSQAPPTLSAGSLLPELLPEVSISAREEGVPLLGAVLSYGQVVAPLQQVWQAECAAAPQRHQLRLGCAVAGLKDLASGVEVDADIAETFDLVVVAEGGVFADQARKAVSRDYRQNAWVGTVVLEPPPGAADGVAFERFTRHGPVALLPLPGLLTAGQRRASLVWCVPADDDPVAPLSDSQRLAVLATLLPQQAGRLRELGPLKCFALGLNAERSLVAGRRVRIGNAAQTLHPVAGQGLNLGLRDAQALVHGLRQASDLDAALRRVAWSRAPDRWSMIAATDLLARGFTWQWPGLAAARGLGLAALRLAPPLRSLLARRMMFGWR